MKFLNKRGQLGVIEAKFFLYGAIFGIVALVVVIVLSNQGIIPKIPFLTN